MKLLKIAPPRFNIEDRGTHVVRVARKAIRLHGK